MELAHEFAHQGKTVRGKHLAGPFARPDMTAGRVGHITIDGKLDDWSAVKPRPMGGRWQVGDNPRAWTGPGDCSAGTRIGYDERNLYVAVDVADDALLAEGGASWQRDGVEVFWDPRGPGARGRPYAGACRQVAVPLPAKGEKAAPEIGPAGAKPAARVKAACLRREGGYAVELAIAISSIAEGFKIGPGVTLRVEVLVNDKDDPDPKAPTTCMSTSGYTKANYRTFRYAELTFK